MNDFASYSNKFLKIVVPGRKHGNVEKKVVELYSAESWQEVKKGSHHLNTKSVSAIIS